MQTDKEILGITKYTYDSLYGHVCTNEVEQTSSNEAYRMKYVFWMNLAGYWYCNEYQVCRYTNLDSMMEEYGVKADPHYNPGRTRGPYVHNICNHPSTNLRF